jgi:hypothetical protein
MSKKETLMIVDKEARIRKSPIALVDKLSRNKRNFLVRETPFMTSLVYDGKEIIYTKKSMIFPPSQLWIFRNVKMDAEKFAKRVDDKEVRFVMPEKRQTNVTNPNYDDSYGVITGTDVNSAYWTIAMHYGIISQRTYEKAGDDFYKVTRLAALAILGRTMLFKEYKEGKLQKEPKLLEGSKVIRDFYRAIRFKCYEHMSNIADLLGNDFDAYRTDCIYYRDTPENRQIVYDYLDAHGFNYKQLVFGEEEEGKMKIELSDL